jgi:hypothetical protein
MRRSIVPVIAVASALAVGLFATAPGAQAAAVFKGFQLNGGSGKLPAIQVAGSSIRSFSLGINSNFGSGAGWGGSRYAPSSASELTITIAHPAANELTELLQAATLGTHYKSASLLWEGGGTGFAYCLSDAFVSSFRAGTDLKDPTVTEVGIAYGKLTVKTGSNPSCSGTSVPAVQSNLLALRGKSLVARLDCLSASCSGLLAVNFPPDPCRGGRSCSFTGGVRAGLNLSRLGKVKFRGSTAEFTGGVKIQASGGNKFAMGDGSVKILKLAVPAPLLKWLRGHRHASLGAIIVVRGSRRAIIQREMISPTPRLPSGAPTGAEAAPGETQEPPLQPQALAITECSTPVVGTPTVVTVRGSLSPARGNVPVTLTYTPTNGPLPLPAPVVDNVSTNAAGIFEEAFDRQREGNPYAWNVVASVAAGEGFAAAQSPACSVPIP